MRDIFLKRVFLGKRSFCLGITIFLTLCGFWLIFPSPATGQNQELLPRETLSLVESGKRWIEVNLSTQRLIAWKGGKSVAISSISSGKSSTPTYPGVFKIERKLIQDRMRGADYDIANVPYAMYYNRGYAIHAAPWHNLFGTPVSHGCINLSVEQAKWLFQWTTIGTPVLIH